MKAFNSFTRWIDCSLESGLNAISNRSNNNWRGNKDSKTKSPKPSKSKILTTLAPFEEYFSSIQSILIWENPLVSATVLIALNCIYWLLAYSTRRFYSILFIISLIVSIHNCWVNYIWPEIRVPINKDVDNEGCFYILSQVHHFSVYFCSSHSSTRHPVKVDVQEKWTSLHPRFLSAPEISQYLNQSLSMIKNVYTWLYNLRLTHPGIFCIILSTIFIVTALIGRFVPGVVIVYIITMSIALGPGLCLYVIPPSWFEALRSFWGHSQKEDIHMQSSSFSFHDDEFSLEENLSDQSSLQVLSTSQMDQTLDFELGLRETGHTTDESDKSSNGMHFMPSHFNGNGTDTGDELDDYEIVSEMEAEKINSENREDNQNVKSDM